MNKSSTASVLCLIILLVSCRPVVQVQDPESYKGGDWVDFAGDFESFWNGMNNNYVFWDIDPTDWDAMYREYKPRFAQLGVYPIAEVNSADFSTALHTAYRYYKEMTKNLIDGHYSLAFKGNFEDKGLSRIAPQNDRVAESFKPDINEFDFWKNTWSDDDPDDLTTYDFMTNVIFPYLKHDTTKLSKIRSGSRSLNLATGEIATSGGGTILYFYFNHFDLYNNSGDKVIAQVINTLKSKDLAGVIIDVRWNSGGYVKDLGFLWGRMIEQPLTPAYTRSKSGEGRLDYMPWTPFTVHAAPSQERMKSLGVPIVLLVNKLSVSCAETSALIVKQMKNGTLIGERTFGGLGMLSENFAFNGGTFSSGILYSQVYTPGAMIKSYDGNMYESIGVPVDCVVPLKWERFLATDGTDVLRGDTQLEEAIKLIDPDHSF